VKRLLAVLAGGIGLGALLGRLRRRPAEPAVSPADELRAKLAEAESRAGEEAVAPEPDAAPSPEEPDDVTGRRRDVHDRARRALDELG
jgi:hypothetical protein